MATARPSEEPDRPPLSACWSAWVWGMCVRVDQQHGGCPGTRGGGEGGHGFESCFFFLFPGLGGWPGGLGVADAQGRQVRCAGSPSTLGSDTVHRRPCDASPEAWQESKAHCSLPTRAHPPQKLETSVEEARLTVGGGRVAQWWTGTSWGPSSCEASSRLKLGLEGNLCFLRVFWKFLPRQSLLQTCEPKQLPCLTPPRGAVAG